jgi:serine/threonine protein kinase
LQRNIFLNDGDVKLGDFGSAKNVNYNVAKTVTGTPLYMSPEMLTKYFGNEADLEIDDKTDIWFV